MVRLPWRDASRLEQNVKNGNARVTGDEQYYTPDDICDQIVKVVQSVVKDWKTRHWIEPAAGTGNFVKAEIRGGVLMNKIIATDLHPMNKIIIKSDFLDSRYTVPTGTDSITVTNPPFGRNNSLCLPFFNKAATFSEYICIIVPKS